MRIGAQELIVVLIIVLIIFGPKNLPKLGKMFGKTMKSFKDGINDDEAEDSAAATEKKSETKGSDEE